MSKANENDSVTLISNQHGSFLDLFNAMQGNVKDFDWEQLKPNLQISYLPPDSSQLPSAISVTNELTPITTCFSSNPQEQMTTTNINQNIFTFESDMLMFQPHQTHLPISNAIFTNTQDIFCVNRIPLDNIAPTLSLIQKKGKNSYLPEAQRNLVFHPFQLKQSLDREKLRKLKTQS